MFEDCCLCDPRAGIPTLLTLSLGWGHLEGGLCDPPSFSTHPTPVRARGGCSDNVVERVDGRAKELAVTAGLKATSWPSAAPRSSPDVFAGTSSPLFPSSPQPAHVFRPFCELLPGSAACLLSHPRSLGSWAPSPAALSHPCPLGATLYQQP